MVTLMTVTTPEPLPQQSAPPPAYPPPPPGYGVPYAGQPLPAQPPKKGMPTWAIVLLVLGGLMVVACVGGVALMGLGAKSISDGNTAAKKDVSIGSCSAAGGQFDFVGPKATVDVTNHGSREASYSISVEFVSSDGGTQLGTGTAFVNNLGPGQTAHADASSFKGRSGASTFECRITKVNKF